VRDPERQTELPEGEGVFVGKTFTLCAVFDAACVMMIQRSL
jgi:hypothetical protein